MASNLMRYLRLQEEKKDSEKNTKKLKDDIQRLQAILAAEMGSSCTAVCDRDGKRYTVTCNPVRKPMVDKDNLASWQLELARETHEAQIEAGVAELRKAWGRKADANQKAVVALLSRVDRQLGSDEFSRAIGASGAANSPAVCKGLLAIAQMLSEDAMGRGGSGDMPVKPETALEGIENAFREMRAKL